MTLSVADWLMYSTMKITALDGGLNEISSGSGFFYACNVIDGEGYLLLITNKHVLDGAQHAKLHFNLKDISTEQPIIGRYSSHTVFNISTLRVDHPDPNVDLAAIRIGHVAQNLISRGIHPYFSSLTKDLIPTQEQWESFTAIEEVVMVGYPNGIWDQVNNFPVFRRGITATHSRYQYNGKDEFLIDCAVFPGSSGSPVLLFNQGSYSQDGQLFIGSRMLLLGIQFAVYQHSTVGDIQVVDVPAAKRSVSVSMIPNNLGFVIKSTKLLDFEILTEPLRNQSAQVTVI
ncbi:S1 family peptidase [Alicyclobacillus acidoterrestris]|uniref:S1 family peptidase n=1 Tax=Alicyclobacillus acidoterrestris TaxID=1450 RepID=UPI003F52C1F2